MVWHHIPIFMLLEVAMVGTGIHPWYLQWYISRGFAGNGVAIGEENLVLR